MASLILEVHNWIQQARGRQTNIDRHSCKRTVPMRVLVLGYSRTGTTSMVEALHELGISDVYHATSFYKHNPRDCDMWVEAFEAKFGNSGGKPFGRAQWDRLLGHCMAVSDAPIVPHFQEDIIEAYPEAKVVISLRDSPEAWWKSYRDTLLPFAEMLLPNDSLTNRLYRAFLPRMSFDKYHEWIMSRTGSLDDVRAHGPAIYVDHNETIRRAVAEKRGAAAVKTDLLEFNVKQGYKPLCDFLGIPVPLDQGGKPRPFPFANDKLAFKQDSAAIENLMNFLVGVNVACTAAAVAFLAWGAKWYMGRQGIAFL